jgi:hypothetical protein
MGVRRERGISVRSCRLVESRGRPLKLIVRPQEDTS